MSKNFLRMATLLMIVVSLVSYSCEKDDDSDDNNNNNNNNESNLLPQTLTMEVEGASWEADKSTIGGKYWDPEIIIQGSRKDGSSNIQLVYEDIWVAGTYEFKNITYNAPNGNYVLTDSALSEVEFSEFIVDDPSAEQDSTITGTFSATLVDTISTPMDTIEITNGYFENIYYNN